MFTKKIRLGLFLLLILTITGLAQGAEPQQVITVKDLAGRTVSFKPPIKRIVLLRSRDVYELAALLGEELPQKLVAWGPDIKTADKNAYEMFVKKYPALENLPETGDMFADAVSAEQLVALKPDLIIIDIVVFERGFKFVDKLKEAKLPLLFLDGSTDPLRSPQKSIILLGKVLSKEKRARQITAYVDQRIAAIDSRLKRFSKPAPIVYLEHGGSGASKFGSAYGAYGTPKHYSSWGEMLRRLKVKNIADSKAGNMTALNPEYVLKANPEVIVITGAYWPKPSDTMRLGYKVSSNESKRLLEGFLARPGWSTLTAVKEHRVYGLFHGFAMHIFDFVGYQGLAKSCYPEEFKDIDPQQEIARFHELFMPIESNGTWFLSVK